MNEKDIVKCSECSSRDIDHDTEAGEVVCNACGTVLMENQIDNGHASGMVGENAHMSATRNELLGGKSSRKTRFDPAEAKKNGFTQNKIRLEQRAHAKRNERGHGILDRIQEITGSEASQIASAEIVSGCFTKKKEGVGGELPLNQMRFLGGKDKNYVIDVCSVATLKVLSDLGKIDFCDWANIAKSLGLKLQHINRASTLILERMKRLFSINETKFDPRHGKKKGLEEDLDFFEKKLAAYIRDNNIERGPELLDWIHERIRTLNNRGDGPLGGVSPRILVAMIAFVGKEKFDVKGLKKKVIAGDICGLTPGGVKSRLGKIAIGNKNYREAIEEFKT